MTTVPTVTSIVGRSRCANVFSAARGSQPGSPSRCARTSRVVHSPRADALSRYGSMPSSCRASRVSAAADFALMSLTSLPAMSHLPSRSDQSEPHFERARPVALPGPVAGPPGLDRGELVRRARVGNRSWMRTTSVDDHRFSYAGSVHAGTAVSRGAANAGVRSRGVDVLTGGGARLGPTWETDWCEW